MDSVLAAFGDTRTDKLILELGRKKLTKLLQSRWEEDEGGGAPPIMGGPGSQKLEGGATATSSPGSSNA